MTDPINFPIPEGFRLALDVQDWKHFHQSFGLPREPWACMMLHYCFNVGRLMEQFEIRYEGDTKHQEIDYKGIATGLCALYGVDREHCFKPAQWRIIDRVLARAKFPTFAPWASVRHCSPPVLGLILPDTPILEH